MNSSNVWPNGMPEQGNKAQRSREVTPHDIELFTEISGDRNPLHYDQKAAAGTRFGGIVIQGGVTSAILNAVVAEDLPGPGTVFLQVNWAFKAPVRPGDTITGEVEVTKVRSDKPITELDTRVFWKMEPLSSKAAQFAIRCQLRRAIVESLLLWHRECAYWFHHVCAASLLRCNFHSLWAQFFSSFRSNCRFL